MTSGKVNFQDEPEVYVSLMIDGRLRRKRAIVDTGFNGYLSPPASFAKNWYFSGYEQYEIATGDIVEQKVYLGKILWNRKIRDVYAVTSHADDILIGTKLLRQNILVIDFAKKRVSIK